MGELQPWKKPLAPFDRRILRGLDDTNTPYVAQRLAFRPCATGTLRLHAAETWYGSKGVWFALVLRLPSGAERAWFYRDEMMCWKVYAAWAGHGDPEGFDFSFEIYDQDRPEISWSEVIESANPLFVMLPASFGMGEYPSKAFWSILAKAK